MLENPSTLESKSGQIVLIDSKVSTIKTVHDLLYSKTGIQNISQEFDVELLKFAHKYDIQPLYRACSKVIKNSFNQDNVMDILKAADLFNDNKLFKAAVEFVNENIKKNKMSMSPVFTKTQKWKDFMDENKECALKVMKIIMFENLD